MSIDRYFIVSHVPHVQFVGIPQPESLQLHISKEGKLAEDTVHSSVFGNKWHLDSRLVESGDLFVALPGKHLDGHDFVLDAIQRGAAACMVRQDRYELLMTELKDSARACLLIVVPDCYEALLALARAKRAQFTGHVVGITGSVGKTTTKELLCKIVNLQGISCLASQGNHNTLLGLALTFLRIEPEHRVLICEMGVNQKGEMAKLAEFVRPTTAVITTVGHSHMEGLGTVQDIALEKRAIFSYLGEKGVGFVNGDQPILADIAYSHPVVRFGSKMVNQMQARKIKQSNGTTTFNLKLYRKRYAITLSTVQRCRVHNSLAAAAVAHYIGVSDEVIVQGIQEGVKVRGRFYEHALADESCYIFDDSHNANPESMKESLAAFEKLKVTGRKIVILGDMLELGETSRFWHRQVGRLLRKVTSLSHAILVGNNMAQWARQTVPYGMSFEVQPTWSDALQAIKERLHGEPTYILVKASRGVGLYNLVEQLIQKEGYNVLPHISTPQ